MWCVVGLRGFFWIIDWSYNSKFVLFQILKMLAKLEKMLSEIKLTSIENALKSNEECYV